MNDPPDLRAVLPHRFPMLLLDRVLTLVPGEQIVAIKAVTCNEPWYARLDLTIDGAGLRYPRFLLVESLLQASAALAGASSPGMRGGEGVTLVGAVVGLRFHSDAYPGDMVTHRVRMIHAGGGAGIYQAASAVGHTPLLTIDRLVTAVRPAGALRAPQHPTE